MLADPLRREAASASQVSFIGSQLLPLEGRGTLLVEGVVREHHVHPWGS